MQCPNCKKDLVPGYECEPCKIIMNPPVQEAPIEPKKETTTEKVKRVVKKAVTKRKTK